MKESLIMIEIGKNIAVLRKKKGITQENLAKNLNVSNQAVSKWESGKCCPDIDILPDLASFFGVSIDELLLGKRISNVKSHIETCDITLHAREIAQENQKISTSILQRKLGIGYGKAKAIIDDMYNSGYLIKDTNSGTGIYLYNDTEK